MVLRAEKGYFVVGKDTDGTTMPHDLGFAGPREKRAGDFIGKRSLFTEVASAPDRRQWAGFEPTQGRAPLPCGAHVVDLAGPRPRSTGFVTSSYWSATLDRPIALGLVERGAARIGETITLQHLGRRFPARVVAPCAFDPKGAAPCLIAAVSGPPRPPRGRCKSAPEFDPPVINLFKEVRRRSACGPHADQQSATPFGRSCCLQASRRSADLGDVFDQNRRRAELFRQFSDFSPKVRILETCAECVQQIRVVFLTE
jgi:hypothetical protein